MSVKLNKKHIQYLMGERMLTGKALAEKMGISPQALSIALGRETFSHINAAKLADALGVPYTEVLRKEE